MGERDRHVEAARPVQGSSSVMNLQSLSLGGKRDDQGHGKVTSGYSSGTSEPERRSEKFIILEEIRWMIQLGATCAEMRDEIYSQLIKQLTKNPDQYVIPVAE